MPRPPQALGAHNYWIVDPDGKRVECHRLAEERFERSASAEGNEVLAVPGFEGLARDATAA